MMIKDGKVELSHGVYLVWYRHNKYEYALDRIFVPVHLRKQGIFKQIFSVIIHEADVRGITISLMVAPDETYNHRLADGLINTAMKHGFTPFEDDGEVYRTDLRRRSKKL